MFSQAINKATDVLARAFRSDSSHRPTRSYRPSIEHLEPRAMLAVVPVGALDVITPDFHVVGWAVDQDVPAQSIDVHFYVDGQFAGSTTANDPRPDVNSVVGVPADHGFRWRIPDQYLDAFEHTVQAYAIDPAGGANRLIGSHTLLSVGFPEFHSRPGAPASIYLDSNGHFEAQWGSFSNISTPAFDLDGNPSTFSEVERSRIRQVWELVSEEFAPFNIDVTTVDPGDFSDGVGLRVSIGGDGQWLGSVAGGVAYRNTFTNDIPNTVYVFSDMLGRNSKAMGEASSHEAGHAFGLHHQSSYNAHGRKTAEYNPGNAAWAPVMGVSYRATRSTWHDGPSSVSATRLQDDMAVIASGRNGFGRPVDDHGDNSSSATDLGNVQNGLSAAGLIETTSDADYFSFDTDGGPLTVSVAVPSGVTNLDTILELRSSTGHLIASASPGGDFGATISTTLNAGSYGLVVRSTGQYGAVGRYTVGRPFGLLTESPELPSPGAPLPADLLLSTTADFNGDGRVDGEDFLVWQANFGAPSGATWATGDADGDGDVDGNDFLSWQAGFGNGYAGGGNGGASSHRATLATADGPTRPHKASPRETLFGRMDAEGDLKLRHKFSWIDSAADLRSPALAGQRDRPSLCGCRSPACVDGRVPEYWQSRQSQVLSTSSKNGSSPESVGQLGLGRAIRRSSD